MDQCGAPRRPRPALRNRLRAGDVWVEGSLDYRRFDAYLPPLDEARQALADSGLETDGPTWLENRRETLRQRLHEVRKKLVRGHLEGVRLERRRLKITPYDAVTPHAAKRLDYAIDTVMPRIRITDLLWDTTTQPSPLVWIPLPQARGCQGFRQRRQRTGTHSRGEIKARC